MRWKDLNLFFDENASFSFYEPSKFFRFGDFKHFFQNVLNFRAPFTKILCRKTCIFAFIFLRAVINIFFQMIFQYIVTYLDKTF